MKIPFFKTDSSVKQERIFRDVVEAVCGKDDPRSAVSEALKVLSVFFDNTDFTVVADWRSQLGLIATTIRNDDDIDFIKKQAERFMSRKELLSRTSHELTLAFLLCIESHSYGILFVETSHEYEDAFSSLAESLSGIFAVLVKQFISERNSEESVLMDPLTGLGMRPSYLKRLRKVREYLIASGQGNVENTAAIIRVSDLGRLNKVSDMYSVDNLLRNMASYLSSDLCDQGACRVGSSKFGIIIDADSIDANIMLAGIREELYRIGRDADMDICISIVMTSLGDARETLLALENGFSIAEEGAITLVAPIDDEDGSLSHICEIIDAYEQKSAADSADDDSRLSFNSGSSEPADMCGDSSASDGIDLPECSEEAADIEGFPEHVSELPSEPFPEENVDADMPGVLSSDNSEIDIDDLIAKGVICTDGIPFEISEPEDGTLPAATSESDSENSLETAPVEDSTGDVSTEAELSEAASSNEPSDAVPEVTDAVSKQVAEDKHPKDKPSDACSVTEQDKSSPNEDKKARKKPSKAKKAKDTSSDDIFNDGITAMSIFSDDDMWLLS